jgi:hypothetical protein
MKQVTNLLPKKLEETFRGIRARRIDSETYKIT